MFHNPLIIASASNVVATIGTAMFAVSDYLGAAIVGGVVSIVTGAVTAWFAYQAKKISENTGKAVNGKMDEFKRMAEEFYLAKGIAEGKAEAEAASALRAAAVAEGVAKAVAEGVAIKALKEKQS